MPEMTEEHGTYIKENAVKREDYTKLWEENKGLRPMPLHMR